MTPRVVYDTMLFLQASPYVFTARFKLFVMMFEDVPSLFKWPADPGDDHIFNLAIHAHAEFLVTWETRMLKLAKKESENGTLLRRLAPNLRIVNPEEFVKILRQFA